MRLRDELKRAFEFRIRKVGKGTREIELSEDMQKALQGLGYAE